VLYKHNDLLCYGGHETINWYYIVSDIAKVTYVATDTSGCELESNISVLI